MTAIGTGLATMEQFQGETIRHSATGRNQQRHAVAVVVERFPDANDHWPILQALFGSGKKRSQRGMKGRPVQPCPSRAAYIRHLKAGEEPCDGCRAANAKHEAERTKEAA